MRHDDHFQFKEIKAIVYFSCTNVLYVLLNRSVLEREQISPLLPLIRHLNYLKTSTSQFIFYRLMELARDEAPS